MYSLSICITQLLREEIKGQRPCLLAGSLQHILRAERRAPCLFL